MNYPDQRRKPSLKLHLNAFPDIVKHIVEFLGMFPPHPNL